MTDVTAMPVVNVRRRPNGNIDVYVQGSTRRWAILSPRLQLAGAYLTDAQFADTLTLLGRKFSILDWNGGRPA
jgi:hypothetical protein